MCLLKFKALLQVVVTWVRIPDQQLPQSPSPPRHCKKQLVLPATTPAKLQLPAPERDCLFCELATVTETPCPAFSVPQAHTARWHSSPTTSFLSPDLQLLSCSLRIMGYLGSHHNCTLPDISVFSFASLFWFEFLFFLLLLFFLQSTCSSSVIW